MPEPPRWSQEDWIHAAREAQQISKQAEAVVDALRVWSEQRWNQEDRNNFQRIETIRTRYKRSDEPLQGLVLGRERETTAPKTHLSRPKPLRQFVRASKRPEACQLIYALVTALNPRVTIELGTCVGISSSYLAAAGKSPGAAIYTIEGAPDIARKAQETWRELGLASRVNGEVGLIHEQLPNLLARTSRVDFAFVDGHHAEEATILYFNQIAERMIDGGLMLLDDIRWSPRMLTAWNALRVDPRVRMSIDLVDMGLCYLGPGKGRLELIGPAGPTPHLIVRWIQALSLGLHLLPRSLRKLSG